MDITNMAENTGSEGTGQGSEASASAPERPYHAKRPHRKSRTGCRNCKARKVKCDEGRPACRACTARGENCVYAAVAPKPTIPSSDFRGGSSTAAASATGRSALSLIHEEALQGFPGALTQHQLVHQPLFLPAGHSELDMRLLWFYTMATYASFSTSDLKLRNVDVVLKVNVVRQAFANPFLMDCVLGLAAMHVRYIGMTNMGLSRAKEISLRARAFETYRKAVEAADPATYPALLASSLLLCGLSTYVFRPGDDGADALAPLNTTTTTNPTTEPTPEPLAILDWMVIWRGIGLIIEATSLPSLVRSGIARLVFRPSVDLPASSRCIPHHLLAMVAAIRPDDPDYPLLDAYYKALQYLGSLYLELRAGISQTLLLRIATYFTFVPRAFINASRERRPRILVILAHYLVFLKLRARTCWWMDGVCEHQIPVIARFLGPAWEHVMQVPLRGVWLSSDRDVVRLLLDDPTWDVPPRFGEEPVTAECERDMAVRAAMVEDGGGDGEVSPEVVAAHHRMIGIVTKS